MMSFTEDSPFRLVADELFASIPEFDGVKNSLENFIESCENIYNLYKIENNPEQDQYLCYVFTSHLTGDAAFTISTDTDLKTWTDLKLLLIQQYGHLILYENSIPTEIGSLQIGNDESYANFCARIQQAKNTLVCNLNNIDENLQKLKTARLNRLAMNQFLYNLPIDLVNLIRSKGCSTLQHALYIAIEEISNRFSIPVPNYFIQPVSDLPIKSLQTVKTPTQSYHPDLKVPHSNLNVGTQITIQEDKKLVQACREPLQIKGETTKNDSFQARSDENNFSCIPIQSLEFEKSFKTETKPVNKVTNPDPSNESLNKYIFNKDLTQKNVHDFSVSDTLEKYQPKETENSSLSLTSELECDTNSNSMTDNTHLNCDNDLTDSSTLTELKTNSNQTPLSETDLDGLTDHHTIIKQRFENFNKTDQTLTEESPDKITTKNRAELKSNMKTATHDTEFSLQDTLMTIQQRFTLIQNLTNDNNLDCRNHVKNFLIQIKNKKFKFRHKDPTVRIDAYKVYHVRKKYIATYINVFKSRKKILHYFFSVHHPHEKGIT